MWLTCLQCRTAIRGDCYSVAYCNTCYTGYIVNAHDSCAATILRVDMQIKEKQAEINELRLLLHNLRKEARRCGLELTDTSQGPLGPAPHEEDHLSPAPQEE